MMKFFGYNPGSRLALVTADVKVVWALGISIGILLSDSGVVQLALGSILLGITFYAGMNLIELAGYLKLFLPVFLIIFLLHLFYQPGGTILQVWFLEATDKGLKAGLFNLLRFINFILLAICFFSTTSPVEFIQSIFRLSKPISGSGPVKKRFFKDMVLTFFVALRFVPVLTQETRIVKMAMISRGADFRHGLVNKIKTNFMLILPLFLRVLNQSNDVAAALALKGYRGEYLAINRNSLKGRDILLIIIALILTCILVLL